MREDGIERDRFEYCCDTRHMADLYSSNIKLMKVRDAIDRLDNPSHSEIMSIIDRELNVTS